MSWTMRGVGAAALVTLQMVLVVAAGAAPLAIKIAAKDSGLGAAELKDLRGLRKAVRHSKYADKFFQTRTFGTEEREGGDGAGGHETVFVHGEMDRVIPGMRDRLTALAVQADATAGWGVLKGTVPNPRCLELIRYHAAADTATLTNLDSLGWHSDGATLITMVVMLSSEDNFEGGAVELRGDEAGEQYMLRPGDALMWKGWTSHRVTPVTRGVREVFVAEWWSGADCAVTLQPRDDDSVEGLKLALGLSPDSAYLHRELGATLCIQLPCKSPDLANEAEALLRTAVDLAPRDATAALYLGRFLHPSPYWSTHTEAENQIRRSHALDPNVVGELPEWLQNPKHVPLVCQLFNAAVCDKVPIELVGKFVAVLNVFVVLVIASPVILWAMFQEDGSSNRRVPKAKEHPRAHSESSGNQQGRHGPSKARKGKRTQANGREHR
jgi:hypothetical protein